MYIISRAFFCFRTVFENTLSSTSHSCVCKAYKSSITHAQHVSHTAKLLRPLAPRVAVPVTGLHRGVVWSDPCSDPTPVGNQTPPRCRANPKGSRRHPGGVWLPPGVGSDR